MFTPRAPRNLRTRRIARRLTIAGCALALVAGTSACGSDDADGPIAAAAPAPTETPAPTTAPAGTDPVTTDPAVTADTASHQAGHPESTAAQTTPDTTVVEPGPLSVLTREYEFVGLPSVVRAGTYSITVTNEGMEAHELVIFQPTTGKTLEELEAGGPANFANDAKIAGYFPPAGLGAVTGPIEVTLEPGEYTVVCFLPALSDGQGHFQHGMVETLTVVP